MAAIFILSTIITGLFVYWSWKRTRRSYTFKIYLGLISIMIWFTIWQILLMFILTESEIGRLLLALWAITCLSIIMLPIHYMRPRADRYRKHMQFTEQTSKRKTH